MRNLRKSVDKEGGFTVVELMVVILVLGVIMAIAIPLFTSQIQRANDAVVESDVRNVSMYVETLLVRTEAYSITNEGSYVSEEITLQALNAQGELIDTETVPLSDGVFVRVVANDNEYSVQAYHVNGYDYTPPVAGGMPFTHLSSLDLE